MKNSGARWGGAGRLASSACTTPTSCWRCCSSGGVRASSQWASEMKYSSDGEGTTSSTRNGRIGMPRLTVRSISRRTCGDWFEFSEKTRTVSLVAATASTMDVA